LVLTEKQKITQFEISSGNFHDVAGAKNVPKKMPENRYRKVSIPFWLYAFQIPFPNSGFCLFFSRYFCLYFSLFIAPSA
jgi:hypothetical protein